MAKVECFDAEGNVHKKEPVDARECVAHCGFTMVKSENKAAEKADDAPEPQVKKVLKGKK